MAKKYTKTNLLVSLTRHVANMLLDAGYDIYWHEVGETESQSVLQEAKDTVTLVEEFPTNPAFITRLNTGTPAEHEVAVPALSVQMPGPERKVQRYGLGDSRWLKEHDFRVDGLARSSFQQKALEELFIDWLDTEGRQLSVWDYQDSELNPPALDPIWIEQDSDSVSCQRLESEDYDAIEFYVRAEANLRYVE